MVGQNILTAIDHDKVEECIVQSVHLVVGLSCKSRHFVRERAWTSVLILYNQWEAYVAENAFLVGMRSLQQLWSWWQHHIPCVWDLSRRCWLWPSYDRCWPCPTSRSLLLYTSCTSIQGQYSHEAKFFNCKFLWSCTLREGKSDTAPWQQVVRSDKTVTATLVLVTIPSSWCGTSRNALLTLVKLYLPPVKPNGGSSCNPFCKLQIIELKSTAYSTRWRDMALRQWLVHRGWDRPGNPTVGWPQRHRVCRIL